MILLSGNSTEKFVMSFFSVFITCTISANRADYIVHPELIIMFGSPLYNIYFSL